MGKPKGSPNALYSAPIIPLDMISSSDRKVELIARTPELSTNLLPCQPNPQHQAMGLENQLKKLVDTDL